MKKALCIPALVAAIALGGCAVQRLPAQAATSVPGAWQAPLPHNGAVGELSQ